MSSPSHFSLLVVDDEPDLRTLYELTLLREGYDLDTAGTVRKAHVGDDRAVGAVLEMEQRFLDGAGGVEVVALAQKRQLIKGPEVRFVVDDEQAEVRGSGHEVSVGRSVVAAATARRMSTKKSLRRGSSGGSSR